MPNPVHDAFQVLGGPAIYVFRGAAFYIYPALRLLAAFGVVWFCGDFSKNQRQFAGISSAVVSGFLTYTYLEPLFVPAGSDVAMVLLYLLVFNAILVGMSLGVLLPVPLSGLAWGCGLTILVGAFVVEAVQFRDYFPGVAAILGVSAAIACVKLGSTFFLSWAVAIEGGAFASCLVVKPLLPFLMDVVRGYPYYPRQPEDYNVSVQREFEYAMVCLMGALLVIACSVYRSTTAAHFSPVSMLRSVQGYSPVATTSESGYKQSTLPPYRDPPVIHEAYNMFDSADLPPRLTEYANMVYTACEDLGNFFGFQDSSVRNQAEHLLILLSNNRRYMSSHILPPSVQPPSPIHALHAKVFSNYVKWCRAMGVPPHFSKMNSSMNAPPAVASRVVDLVLYFCVWGEGSNLRHMPECLWFLYHKMMEEYIRSEGYTQTRSLYAGHYLDNVVTPIFDIVQKSMKAKHDHEDKKNYDDFNEFFWSRNCLRYRYSAEDPSERADVEGLICPLPDESLPPVVDGMASSPKTFLEKRSWLRGLLALNRILEWHIVTFYLLGVIAFARELVWGWVFSLQVASAVFWLFNALHLCWAVLEVWGSYPGIHLSETEISGSVFVLLARFLTLVYQTLYLMWAFASESGTHLGINEDATFWWWQYVWLSLLIMAPYIMESFVQLFPFLGARIYTSQNDYVQSFLNILYPLSRLYTGKEIQESFGHAAVYVFFWVTLMAWKLFFSYIFEVYSMVLPTLQLTDDYMNYPNQSFTKMVLLLGMRWLPQFIVYLIDMSIWYAVWQAFAGTTVGFSDHLGDVRSMDDIRANFGRAPEHFCKKMLSPDAGSRRGSSASFLGSSGNNLSEKASLLGSDPHRLQSYVNRLLDVRIQKWVMFSAAWNEIIDHFRQEDIISNAEMDNLKFSQFDGFNQAIYLPVFQTAGVIENVLSELERPADDYTINHPSEDQSGALDKPMVESAWRLVKSVIGKLLGPVHRNDVDRVGEIVDEWIAQNRVPSQIHLDANAIDRLREELHKVTVSVQKGIRKSTDTDVLSELSTNLSNLIVTTRGYLRSSGGQIWSLLTNLSNEIGDLSGQLDVLSRNSAFRNDLKELHRLVRPSSVCNSWSLCKPWNGPMGQRPVPSHYTDRTLFRPISEDITMQTAVAEVWELGAFFFIQVLGPMHSADVHAVIDTVNKWISGEEITSHMNVVAIRNVTKQFVGAIQSIQKGIHRRKPSATPRSRQKKNKSSEGPPTTSGGRMRRVVSAGSLSSLETDVRSREKKPQTHVPDVSTNPDIIDALRDQVRDKLRNLIHAVKALLKDAATSKDSTDMLDRLTFMASMENGFFWDDGYASDQLDDVSRNSTFKSVLKKLHGLMCMHPDEVEPKSKEVRRRLTFFVNSLFMDMPDAPSIHDMFSWNVLTPYYSEDVTYSKAELEKRSDALGVSTLLYLQTLYKPDWHNFLERLGIKDEEKVWNKKIVDETRRWASIRAQTLSRTVNGMMYCEKALRLLANLERLDDDTTNDLMNEKFGYIVSCQVYGNMKRNQDPKADDIEALMHRFPHLRIAYIDNVRVNRSGASVFYSVLIKSDGKGSIQEVYRVRLPGNPIIGEGKPENQNHAMIFTRGEFVQTIDMNQEGYFEEALKMRNCLQEFAKREGPLPTTILGLREHIFTGSVSSLANYMALQEISFVTLGQRVLTRPLHIRLHYGHPDIFDKLFFITRGGISKASKGINLSEDIFAGYSNVNRGGTVGFKEYVQVGKGRDVGMSQIYKFEAKLSQGAAEQSLSRDVYRMCNRLDFCRLLSFYYGGIGHYFSNVLTILTVYVVVYIMAILAVFNLEKIGDRMITPMGTIQMLLGGLGLLQTIPLFATLGVERGWWSSLQEIILVFVTGGPLHFMFHIQTKATYMTQTILVGGAKYRPTGRGFVTQHTPFDEQYRFFAGSHMYLGVELAAGLALMAVYTNAGQYFGRTWSLWLASGSFLCSPFWFNPLTFDWSTVANDYVLWVRWMQGSTGGAAKSWSMWYNEENAFYKGMPGTSKVLYVTKAVMYTLVADGIRRSNLFRTDTTLDQPLISVRNLAIFVAALFVLRAVFSANERVLPYPVRRTIGILIFSGLLGGCIILFAEDSNYIRYALAGYYAAGAVALIGLLTGVRAVKFIYLIHDIVCAHLIFIPLFVLAALQLPGMIQTWLLYHNALSTDVVVSDILRYARRSQESGSSGEDAEDLAEQVAELRRLVARQQQLLVNAGLAGIDSLSTPTVGDSTTVPPPPEPIVRPPAPSGGTMFSRAVSMSGIDVWGSMAIGDISHTEEPRPQAQDSAAQTPVQATQSQGFSFTQPDTMPPRN